MRGKKKGVIVVFKKMLEMGILALMILTLGACGNRNHSAEQNTNTDLPLEGRAESDSKFLDDESSESNSEKPESDSEPNVLIAYFSWSGNTKQLAGMIQEQIGGELFEIEPEMPYTNDINDLSGISLQEQRDNIRPALSSVVEDISEYEVIFIGFPNWWNNMPMPVFTFLEEYDFTGKTVIPFTTYGNGVWGKSIDSIQEMLPESVILYTLTCVSLYKLTGNERAEQIAKKAVLMLAERYHEKGSYIQAWGEMGIEYPDVKIIIDCMLNLPLLYWSGNEKYFKMAESHADTAAKYLIRPDYTSYHTYLMDPMIS